MGKLGGMILRWIWALIDPAKVSSFFHLRCTIILLVNPCLGCTTFYIHGSIVFHRIVINFLLEFDESDL
jgi:hypothetical protein